MKMAPVGVAAAMAAAVGEQGLGVILQLAKLVGALATAALVIFVSLHLLQMKFTTGIRLGTTLSALRGVTALGFFDLVVVGSALPKAIRAMGGWAYRRISSASCCRPATAST